MDDYICMMCGKIVSNHIGLPDGWLVTKDEFGNDVDVCSVECMNRYDKLIEEIKKEN